MADVFISYAHLDNRPRPQGQEGWVEEFHRELSDRVQELLGEGGSLIWRDRKLTGNDVFSDEIRQQLLAAKALISIVSPRYAKSDWCRREIREFCEAALRSGGLVVEHRSRVFKVVKLPLEPEEQRQIPSPARELFEKVLGYEFYVLDPNRGAPYELDPKAYGARIYDLAWDIKKLLKGLPPPSSKFVYLAETTSDLAAQKDTIRRELTERGYEVLPQETLPNSVGALEQNVRADLERCCLAVHLIGANYGLVPEGSDRCIVDLQNALAAEQSGVKGLPRLIWIPKGLVAKDKRQSGFLKAVREEADCQKGAEIIEDTIETLKTIMVDKLAKPVRAKDTIFLAETTSDLRELSGALREALIDRGYKVLPEKPNTSLLASECEQQSFADLQASHISIHLIGRRYGFIPEEAERSIVHLQHDWATQRSQEEPLAHLIWIPKDLAPSDPRQLALIAQLRQSTPSRATSQLLECPAEELTPAVLLKLDEWKQPQSKPASGTAIADAEPRHVYVIYQEQDAKEPMLRQVMDFLFDKGFEVDEPYFRGDEREILEAHRRRLCDADGIVIYYGNSTALWVDTKLSDLRQCAGFGRTKPMVSLVLVAPPTDSEKPWFRKHQVIVVKQLEKFVPEELEPFLKKLV